MHLFNEVLVTVFQLAHLMIDWPSVLFFLKNTVKQVARHVSLGNTYIYGVEQRYIVDAVKYL